MSIENMHFDLKRKVNKVDSQKYRNLRVQDIDWVLNQAYRVFVKTIAEPRYASQLGFEANTRTINDIRALVVEKKSQVATAFDPKSFAVDLPTDYWFLVSASALGSKGVCTDVLDALLVQHDDKTESNPFTESSFEWRESNFRFYNGGIRIFTDGTFTISEMYLDYIKTIKYMHFANGIQGGTYKLADGTVLTGKQDCELPVEVHSEIVDIAALMLTGQLQIPDYQIKMAGVKLND
jgi:hypothetical protein